MKGYISEDGAARQERTKDCDPLLLFIDVFDSELKWAILESLYLYKIVEIDKLSLLVGEKMSDIFQEIWSLQHHKILLRIDQGNRHYFCLTPAGHLAWQVKNEICLWEKSFYRSRRKRR